MTTYPTRGLDYGDGVGGGPRYQPLSESTRIINGTAPVFTKGAGNPVLEAADTDFTTIMWPWVIKAADYLASPIDDYYMYYSTDHAGSGGKVGMATAPAPIGPWTDYGEVYDDASGSGETETPSVIWDDATEQFFMYYHQSGGIGSQSTMLAKSPDGVTWTKYGIVIDVISVANSPGDGHTGYFMPNKVGRQWFGYHLYGGGDRPHFAISYSHDGQRWQTDPRPLGYGIDQTTSLAANRRIEWNHSTPVMWRGQLWWIGIVSNFTSGSAANDRLICAAPLSADLRHLLGNPIEILPMDAAWETTNIRNLTVYSEDGKLYLYYCIDGDAIGYAIAEGGS